MVGAVLVGGASRRMGAPKVLLDVDGTAMAARSAEALRLGGASPVVLLGGDPTASERLGLPAVEDDRPGEGPLAALASALRWAGAPAIGADIVVVAAGDQPDLTGDLVERLIEATVAAGPAIVGTAPQSADGRTHPFPSAWRTTAAAEVERLVASGARRMGAALELETARVAVAADVVADVDTPEDLAARRARGPGWGAGGEGAP